MTTLLPLLAVLVLLASSTAARADFILGLANLDSGTSVAGPYLIDVDSTTGAYSNPRLLGSSQVLNIATSPSGELFGSSLGFNTNQLFRIDPALGATNLVGNIGLSPIIEGDIAFDPLNGQLYGLQYIPDTATGYERYLFTIDTVSGAGTIVGDLSVPDYSDLNAMAFDRAGRLFVLDSYRGFGPDRLFEVDPATARILRTVSIDYSRVEEAGVFSTLGYVGGMLFLPSDGRLYVSDSFSGTRNLYTLDTESGLLDLVGPTGIRRYSNGGILSLTLQPTANPPSANPVPAPPSVVVFGVAMAAGVVWSRVRRRRIVPGTSPSSDVG